MDEGPLAVLYERLFAVYRDHCRRRGELAEGHFKIARIAEDVRRLSRMFTGRAAADRAYMDDARLRMAYVAYYVYPNMLKVLHVLREIPAFAPSFIRDGLRVLDLGCGPGTGMMGTMLFLREAGVGGVHFTAVDRSAGALNNAAFLVKAFADLIERPVEIETRRRPPEGETYDLIVVANALGEMGGIGGVKAIERHLGPEGYGVIVEPALKASTRRLMETIAVWSARGYRIAAPCLGVTSCPMVSDETLWCHQDREWKRPSFMREIDLRAGLRKESLKYAYLVVTKRGSALGDAHVGKARIVSDLHGRAEKYWCWGCPSGGGVLRKVKFVGKPECLPRRGAIIPDSDIPS